MCEADLRAGVNSGSTGPGWSGTQEGPQDRDMDPSGTERRPCRSLDTAGARWGIPHWTFLGSDDSSAWHSLVLPGRVFSSGDFMKGEEYSREAAGSQIPSSWY